MENKVWTPTGLQSGETNSYVSKGEIIWNPVKEQATIINKGKFGEDDQKSSVQEGDENVVLNTDFAKDVYKHAEFLNKYNKIMSNIDKNSSRSSLSKQTAEVQSKVMQQLKQKAVNALNVAAQNQKDYHNMLNYTSYMPGYKCGKNGYEWGKDDWNSADNIYGGWLNDNQYIKNINLPYTSPAPYRPDIGFKPVQPSAVLIPSPAKTANLNLQSTYGTLGNKDSLPSVAKNGMPGSAAKSTEPQSFKFDIYSNITNGIQRSLPMLASLAQGLWWKKQKVQRPNTFVDNAEGRRALQNMAQMRYNPYADQQAANQKLREAMYDVSQSGGMLGAQRNAYKLALALGGARTAADINASAQERNNQYRQAYNQALMSYGADRANRMHQAMVADNDAYARAVGARQRGIETSMANLVAASQQFAKDSYIRNREQQMMDIYGQQVSNAKTQQAAQLAELTAQRLQQNAQFNAQLEANNKLTASTNPQPSYLQYNPYFNSQYNMFLRYPGYNFNDVRTWGTIGGK